MQIGKIKLANMTNERIHKLKNHATEIYVCDTKEV